MKIPLGNIVTALKYSIYHGAVGLKIIRKGGLLILHLFFQLLSLLLP